MFLPFPLSYRSLRGPGPSQQDQAQATKTFALLAKWPTGYLKAVWRELLGATKWS